MFQEKRVAVIVAAAGSGTRMGGSISKQYVKIGNERVLEKSLKAFCQHPSIDDIYLVVKKEDMEFCRKEFTETAKIPKIRAIISGGKHRQSSVANGLKVISRLNWIEEDIDRVPVPDFVLVHDGARPFVSSGEINRIIKAVAEWGAATLGVPVKDSIAKVEDCRIAENLDRSSLYSIQTPQGFRFSELLQAHKQAIEEKFIGTDDAGLVRRLGTEVALVRGEYGNIKITTPEDLRYAQFTEYPEIDGTLESAEISEKIESDETLKPTGRPALKTSTLPYWRIGIGFDVHAFAKDRRLVLGGIHIPWEYGLQGHSDADVLTHAITDALLGACGFGDIGTHFPDNQPKYKDVSSLKLLHEVNARIKTAGYDIGNIDAVVIAERPKIAPYINEMKSSIADILEIEMTKINIKGTTTERLGFCGREEGIAAMASAAVYRR